MSSQQTQRPDEPLFTPSPRPVDGPARDLTQIGVHPSPGGGIDIVVAAPNATAIDFCVQEGRASATNQEYHPQETRFALLGPEQGRWHGHLSQYGVGTRYGFRAYGPWDPDGGLFYNPVKLLLDPYGRGLEGQVEVCAATHAHHVDADLYPSAYPMTVSNLDSGPWMPRSVVTENRVPIAPGPQTPWDRTVIYEMHVRGFTRQFPDLPEEMRGTYAGLAHPRVIEYLQSLGITAVELLPIHAKMDEPFLSERGLPNYWGYSTLSYFAPEPSYATVTARAAGAGAVVNEFASMVSALHEADIEVILDVVYNHTCEGGDSGPTVCWRGLDSRTYYRRMSHRPHAMIDETGCGNTLNFTHPQVVQMVLDSLRYWVSEMQIDGFRFDLAATLGRLANGFTAFHPLFVAMAADPVLNKVKMIAEPWDVGPGGWQTGGFPAQFSEWNDRYRDTLRGFWLRDAGELSAGNKVGGPADLATRLSGSADMFSRPAAGRTLTRASVNLVTAHDGFTMADLTRYNHKHNLVNLENNQDGSDHNFSWNHGVEGVFDDTDSEPEPEVSEAEMQRIAAARLRSHRNLLATLLVSSGTPMLLAGDEFARTQRGNNNAYCQDNGWSWLDWEWDQDQADLLQVTRYLLALRHRHPVLRPRKFFTGQPVTVEALPDVSWFDRNGNEIGDQQWNEAGNRALQMRRSGQSSGEADALVVINGLNQDLDVELAETRPDCQWVLVFDSVWQTPAQGRIRSADTALADGSVHTGGQASASAAFSVQIYLSACAQIRVIGPGGSPFS